MIREVARWTDIYSQLLLRLVNRVKADGYHLPPWLWDHKRLLWELLYRLETGFPLNPLPSKHVPKTFLRFERAPACVDKSDPVYGGSLDGLQKLGIRRSALSKVEEIQIVHIYNRRDGKHIPSKARGEMCPVTLAPVYLDKKGTYSKKPWRGGTIPLSKPHQGVIRSPAECCHTLAKGCLKIPLHRLEN